jgi:2-polyprenylphenol 6-hydroxylase
MSAMIPEFDVAIIGAGIAGSALACALRNSNLRVVLIEGSQFPSAAPVCETALDSFDARVSALTLSTRVFLESIGIWEQVLALRAEAFAEMHVWDAEGTGEITFGAREIGEPCLGYIVENRVLVYALLDSLKMAANIKLLDNTRVLSVTPVPGKAFQQYHIQLDQGLAIKAGLIVGADGAQSFIRQTFDFKTREWDYGHNAIVCTVQTEKSHRQTAWQRFMPTGPLALLPLSGSDGNNASHFCSIVWSAQSQEAERLMALSDDDFLLAITQATEQKLGKVIKNSRRFSFPLRQRHAVDYVKPGVVLIADAAHTIHPLAGQGINLGLQDVMVLAEELLRASQLGHPVGELRVLSRYQRRRKGENLLMMGVMEGFKRLFEQQSLWIKWIRNRGMLQVAQHSLLKKQLIKQAMGLR